MGSREAAHMLLKIMAPQVGLEPTTLRLTAECSAIELLRNTRPTIAFGQALPWARKIFITDVGVSVKPGSRAAVSRAGQLARGV